MSLKPQTFVINLDRRPDRMMRMSEQLNALGIPFKRIAAVDARSVPDADVDRHFAARGLFGRVPKGDQCCTLSHVEFYRQLLASGARYGLVLEDDVELRADAARLLADLSWLPEEVRLIKMEAIVPFVLVGPLKPVGNGFSVAPLRSKHSGTGAYIIERSLAQWILDEIKVWPITIDHMLFNPHVSTIVKTARPFQLIPAIATQPNAKSDTDIDEWRHAQRRPGMKSFRRSLKRGFSDVAVFPRQVLEVAFGRSRLVRI